MRWKFIHCLALAVITASSVMINAPVFAEETISLDLKDVSVQTAIESIFRNTGKNFTIDPNVNGVMPSVSFTNVSFDQALKSITKSAGLVYRVDGNIYVISKRPDVVRTNQEPINKQVDFPVVEPVAEETVIEKVPLNFAGATEVLQTMQGDTAAMNNNNRFGFGGGYGGIGGMGGYGGYGGFGGTGSFGGSGSGFGGYGSGIGGYGGGYGGFGSGSYGGFGGYGGYGGSGYGGYGYMR